MIDCERYIEIILNCDPDEIREHPNLSSAMEIQFLSLGDKFLVGYKNFTIHWVDTNTISEESSYDRRMDEELMKDKRVVEKLNELIRMYSL